MYAKHRSKNYYDKKINSTNFRVGDYVFLLRGPKPGKFGDHYTGPHKILEVINKTNIRIQFKGNGKIVHSNRLRKSCINYEIKSKKRKGRHSEDEYSIHDLITDVRDFYSRFAASSDNSFDRK